MSDHTTRALWLVVPFSLIVAMAAFALVGAPGVDHGLATEKVPTHTMLTRREWVDLAVGTLALVLALAIAVRLLLLRRTPPSGGDAPASPMPNDRDTLNAAERNPPDGARKRWYVRGPVSAREAAGPTQHPRRRQDI